MGPGHAQKSDNRSGRWGLALRTFLRFRPVYLLANLLTSVRFVVRGNSMRPALICNQYVLVSRMAYLVDPPSRGDMVVIRNPSQPLTKYIKRIIGLPGEHIMVDMGLVFVDGWQLEEPYLDTELTDAGFETHEHRRFPLTEWYVNQDEYFVLGDNRNHSADSRSFGPIHSDLIIGKSWLRYWPFRDWGFPA